MVKVEDPGDTFRAMRLLRRMTQRDLSGKTGIPQSRISAIENGLKMKPDEEKAILRALK